MISSDAELTITGRVERVTYSSPDTGFAVLRIRPARGARFTATGLMPELLNNAGLEGTEFEFCGSWTVNKYGRQFAFSICNLVGSELIFFLSKIVKGIGQKLALELIDRYGEEELVRILDHEPEELPFRIILQAMEERSHQTS